MPAISKSSTRLVGGAIGTISMGAPVSEAAGVGVGSVAHVGRPPINGNGPEAREAVAAISLLEGNAPRREGQV